jgi:hypothetical protein
MGSGRTLRKHSHTRPIKSQGEKRRRTKVQRARLVKFGMDEAVVKKMQPEDVRVLVQRPVKVKKIVAAKAAGGAKPDKAVKTVKPAKTVKVAKPTKAEKPAKVAKPAKKAAVKAE